MTATDKCERCRKPKCIGQRGYICSVPGWEDDGEHCHGHVNDGHQSDCAVHNEPAFPAGACDCTPTADRRAEFLRRAELDLAEAKRRGEWWRIIEELQWRVDLMRQDQERKGR